MNPYLGDFPVGATVRHMWASNAIAGESITRATNGTIAIYKDHDTTQDADGVTDSEDFDGVVGVHAVAVDMTADGTFYSSGADFQAVLAGATIDGKTINVPLFCWSVNNRSHLRPTNAGRTLDITTTGAAGIDLGNVENQSATLSLTGTTIKNATDVEADTQDIQSRLPAALVGGRMDSNMQAAANGVITSSVVADGFLTAAKFASGAFDAVWTVTTRTLSSFGTLVADTASAVWSAVSRTLTDKTGFELTAGERTAIANEVESQIIDEADAEKVLEAITNKIAEANPDLGDLTLSAIAAAVWGAATRRLSDGTNIVLAKGTGITGFNDLDAAGVRGAVGLASANLDTQLGDIAGDAGDAAVAAAKFETMIEDQGGGVYGFTEEALEQAPTGGGGTAPTAAENAAAVWDAARADHVGAGTFGEGVASVQGNVTGSTASVVGNVGGNVQGTVASVSGNVGGNVQGSVASVAGNVAGSVGSVSGNVGGNVNGSVGSLATQAKADVNAEADAAIADANLVSLINAVGTLATTINTKLGAPVVSISADILTRLASGSYVAPYTPAQIADGFLDRHLAGGSDATGSEARSVRNSLRALRNRREIVNDELTVYEEDDDAVAWTAVTQRTAGNPLSSVNPSGGA